MHFLLDPLIINILLLLIPTILVRIIWVWLDSIVYKKFNIYEYKIHNKLLSIILIISYVSIFIIFFYLLRLYHIPRSIDLNLIWINITHALSKIIDLLNQYSWVTTIYMVCILLQTMLIITGLIIKWHRMVYKEIYKFYLYFSAHQMGDNYHIRRIRYKFFSLALANDIIHHFAEKVAWHFTIKSYGERKHWNLKELPFYNSVRIVNTLMGNNYYNKFMQLSPLFFIIYDCTFNNFVITHVFYYLLFYIPLRLLKRISQPFLDHAPYITNMLHDIYYKDESCFYAIAPNLYPILKSYILSGVIKNPDLGVQLQTELFICAVTRFEEYTEFNISSGLGIYANVENEFLHTYDHIHFFHVVPDENDNPIHGEEWIVFANKLKK